MAAIRNMIRCGSQRSRNLISMFTVDSPIKSYDSHFLQNSPPHRYSQGFGSLSRFASETSHTISISGTSVLRLSSSYSTSDLRMDNFVHAELETGSSFTRAVEKLNGEYQKGFNAVGILFFGVPIGLLSTMTTSEAKEKLNASPEGKVVLYQYEACPFCNKVKAYLDYRDIPYQVVEVNPVGKNELKWSDYKKVPILVVGNEQLNDSTAIITTLEQRLNPNAVVDAGADSEETEEGQWRKWVDSHLVHLLSPNIYRTPSEALEAFNYITSNGNFSSMQRMTAKYVGATAMYFIGKKLKKKYNIVDERLSLYEAAQEWVAALDGRDFLGGDKPNMADLAVFGVLRPIINLQAGKDLLANSDIGPWYERMTVEVGSSNRIN